MKNFIRSCILHPHVTCITLNTGQRNVRFTSFHSKAAFLPPREREREQGDAEKRARGLPKKKFFFSDERNLRNTPFHQKTKPKTTTKKHIPSTKEKGGAKRTTFVGEKSRGSDLSREAGGRSLAIPNKIEVAKGLLFREGF